jgi:hypothetical protein
VDIYPNPSSYIKTAPSRASYAQNVGIAHLESEACSERYMISGILVAKELTIFSLRIRNTVAVNATPIIPPMQKNGPYSMAIKNWVETTEIAEQVIEKEWGYARIQGELKKLDITISKSSVANILKKEWATAIT